MKNILNFCKKNAFYVMALVLVAGILAVAGIAGFVSGQNDQEIAENAAEFNDKTVAVEEADTAAGVDMGEAVADEATGYDADIVQKILSMIEDGTLALEDFEDENSLTADAEDADADGENADLAGSESAVASNSTDASGQTGDAANDADADDSESDGGVSGEEAALTGTTVNAGYQAKERLTWPVEGEIVLDYSMDATTYFPTLEEYKCNPSVLIQSEAGSSVLAVYAGTVLDIYDDAQLGTVVAMSLGNGYEALYGQLENVSVAVGESVEEGQVIGAVAEPTRYYTVEGSHLNFQLTKDGDPVDPLDYLD